MTLLMTTLTRSTCATGVVGTGGGGEGVGTAHRIGVGHVHHGLYFQTSATARKRTDAVRLASRAAVCLGRVHCVQFYAGAAVAVAAAAERVYACAGRTIGYDRLLSATVCRSRSGARRAPSGQQGQGESERKKTGPLPPSVDAGCHRNTSADPHDGATVWVLPSACRASGLDALVPRRTCQLGRMSAVPHCSSSTVDLARQPH